MNLSSERKEENPWARSPIKPQKRALCGELPHFAVAVALTIEYMQYRALPSSLSLQSFSHSRA